MVSCNMVCRGHTCTVSMHYLKMQHTVGVFNALFGYRLLIKLQIMVLVSSELLMSETISAGPLSCVSEKLLHCVYGYCMIFKIVLFGGFFDCLGDLFCVDTRHVLTAASLSPACGSDPMSTCINPVTGYPWMLTIQNFEVVWRVG